jgi:hypothetical protein
MKEVVAKHQQVPVADWFLTGEAGFETTVVNLNPSGSAAACFFAFWACRGMAATANAKSNDNDLFIFIFVWLFFSRH